MKQVLPLFKHSAAVVVLLWYNGLLAFILFSGTPSPVIAQSLLTNIQTPDFSIEITGWSRKDGIPYFANGGILQDSRGFIWLLPDHNLTRFDGKETKTYTAAADNPKNFPKSNSIGEDVRQNLWLLAPGDNNASIQIFDPDQEEFLDFESYTGQPLPKDLDTTFLKNIHLFSIHQKVYIFNALNQKLWRYDGTWSLLFQRKQTDPRANLIAPGPDDHIWLLYGNSNLVHLVNRSGAIVTPFPITNSNLMYSSFFLDSDLQLWYFRSKEVIPDEGLRPKKVSGPDSAFPDFTGNTPITFLGLPNGSYQLFSNGMYNLKLDSSSFLNEWNRFLENSDWQSVLFSNIIKGHDNAFWYVGSNRLLRLKPKKQEFFTTFLTDQSVRHINISSSSDTLLVSAYRQNPQYLNTSTHTSNPLSQELYLPTYSTFFQEDTIWGFPLRSKLIKYTTTGKILKRYSIIESFRMAEGRSMRLRDDGTFLFCSNFGIHSFDPYRERFQYILKDIRAYWLHQTKDGRWWAGTEQGLYVLHEGKYYLKNINGKPLQIQHIYEDDQNTFWLSTNQGLIKWRVFSESYQQFSVADGLSSNSLHAAYPDQRGNLWLSSDYGLMAFDTTTQFVKAFFEEDGLSDNELNYLAHARGADGRLYVGSINGITAFHPDSIPLKGNPLPFPIHLGGISLFDQDGQLVTTYKADDIGDQVLPIPPHVQQLEINSILPYWDVEKTDLMWRIPGTFNNWNQINIDGQLQINGLPTGAFAIELKGEIPNKPYSVTTRVIRFQKNPFFYQRPWFIVSALLLSLAILIGAYRWRLSSLRRQALRLEQEVKVRTTALQEQYAITQQQKKRLEEVDAAKTRLFNNISHEFRTPLSLILGHAEQIKQMKSTPASNLRSAHQIKKYTQTLTQMIEEIIDLSKLDSGVLKVERLPCMIGLRFFYANNFFLPGACPKEAIVVSVGNHPQPRIPCRY
jgi:hypothetical protein